MWSTAAQSGSCHMTHTQQVIVTVLATPDGMHAHLLAHLRLQICLCSGICLEVLQTRLVMLVTAIFSKCYLLLQCYCIMVTIQAVQRTALYAAVSSGAFAL